MSERKGGDDPRTSNAATLGVLGTREPASTPSLGDLAAGPQRIAGRYEILNLLGQGGMGAVYRARDLELDELVALKVLRRELVESEPMLARFRQEAKLARRVTHRNVARTFDIGEHEGEKFLTMELVDGESVSALLERRRRLPLKEVGRIGGEVLSGMSAAHAAGVVHRDLKPDNVLIAADGRVVVTDFGIARATAGFEGAKKTLGVIVGTPAYMAPEQVEGVDDLDARADLYAFGAMLYEMLTGERAWPGDAPFAVAAARLSRPPPDPRDVVPGVPEAVAQVVLRCMARQRSDRFATADHAASALAAATSGESTPDLALAPTSASFPLPSSAGGSGAAGPSASSRGLDKTVVVLPFKNGGPPEDEYLADGITDDLIDLLSMTAGLKVRPRSSVLHLGGGEVDPRRVGEELGVQVVVIGSVRRTADAIRVTARLISTSDGFQLWAKRFERPAADLLGVNDEAASAIAQALTVAGPTHARVAPKDPRAIDLYLRAQHEFHKFWRAHVVRAVELYEEALRLAPDDPTILAGCARARVRIAFFGGDRAAEMLALAREAADRAVAGAPELGESWVALATARMMEGDTPGAARAIVTALDRSKGLAPAHELLGRIVLEVKGPTAAMPPLRRALAIDPSNLAPRFELSRAHALLREWAEASALLDLPAPGPGNEVSRFLFRVRLCLWKGEGHPDLTRPPKLGPELGPLRHTEALQELIETREIPESLREALRIARGQIVGRSRRACLFFQFTAEFYGYAFEIDQALEAAQKAVEAGLIDIAWMDLCPVLDAVRKDARFAPLRAEVNARAEQVVRALAK